MDCKKALTDTDGDMTKAAELLRERGIAKAEKKASRIAAEGIVRCYIDGNTGVLLEVNCESDFVAKNPSFRGNRDGDREGNRKGESCGRTAALLACEIDGAANVEEYLKGQTAIIGEKIAVRRFTVYKTEGFLASYIHLGGKLGVMLDMKGEATDAAKEVAHEITLQIAFTKPAYLTEEEVSAETLEREKGSSQTAGDQRR